jgi:anti-sigma factor RsiW
MTCQELVELVTDYCDGALSQADREDFDAHLALCPGCVTYLEQIRTTVRFTRDARTLERRPEVAALLHAFRDWRATRPSPG